MTMLGIIARRRGIEMTKIGPFILIKAAEFPHFQKAHRIARELTEQRIDDILEHRYHLHRNPVKRKSPTVTLDEMRDALKGE